MEPELGLDKAAELAKSYIELAENISKSFLEAVETQQRVQHAQMLETAEMCQRILKS